MCVSVICVIVLCMFRGMSDDNGNHEIIGHQPMS